MDRDDGQGRSEALRRLMACFREGKTDEAERIARHLLDIDHDDEDVLHLLAQLLFREGRAEESVVLMKKLLGLNPMQPGYHNDYGTMLASLGNWVDAEASHRISLVLDPSGVDARFNLALALFKQSRCDDALAVLDVLRKQNRDFAEQYALRGEILRSQVRHADAVEAFSKAVELGLQTPEVLGNLGMALSDTGNKEEAFSMLARSGELNPDDAATNFYLGNLLREQGKQDEALRYFQKAIDAHPDFAEAYNNLGLIQQAKGDNQAAEASFAKAMAAAPALGAVHNNMGNSQLKLGRMDLAVACFRKAVELSPDSFEAWNNLGEAYCRLQRLDEAEAAYRKALAINPACVGAELNLGILLLLRGDYAQGWRHYEKRWEMPHIRDRRPRFKQPEWQGEPLDGKTLVIYVEQGMGDNIQFVRYLPVLRERYPTARIYYWGLKPLQRLFAGLAARCNIELLPETVPGGVPPADYQIALLTIPERLGTTLENIPADVPYLSPSAELVDKWAPRFAGLAGKKVGLVWASGETYLYHKFRTMRLAQLRPLLNVGGVSWVSLQKGNAVSEIVSEGLSDVILNPMEDVDDFADTAAIMSHLDLVISVDTSVAHLAGALGKPVWLLDRFDTDWRWLLGRTDSPWYPTMRIFRQAVFGDWMPVAADAANRLSDWVSGVIDDPLKEPATGVSAGVLPSGDFGDEKLKYRLVRARHGWLLANPNDFYIGQALIEYGEYNELEAEFLHACLLKPGRIIEVGANIGSHTVGLAKAAAERGERMEVFEPQPVIFQNLCANIALNGLRNVRAWPFACGDKTLTLSFAEPDYSRPGNFGGVSMSSEHASSRNISVPCVRLDDVLGDDPVALMKIDVEGFELAALRGSQGILDRWRPVLYVENDRVDESRDLIEWLWSRDYRLFWHIPPLFNKRNYFGHAVNRFGNIASFNMFCIPKEFAANIDGLEEIVDATRHLLSRK